MTKRTVKEIRDQIKKLCSPRAGSIYFEDFEAGWVYGMLWALREEPKWTTRKEVVDFAENFWKQNKVKQMEAWERSDRQNNEEIEEET